MPCHLCPRLSQIRDKSEWIELWISDQVITPEDVIAFICWSFSLFHSSACDKACVIPYSRINWKPGFSHQHQQTTDQSRTLFPQLVSMPLHFFLSTQRQALIPLSACYSSFSGRIESQKSFQKIYSVSDHQKSRNLSSIFYGIIHHLPSKLTAPLPLVYICGHTTAKARLESWIGCHRRRRHKSHAIIILDHSGKCPSKQWRSIFRNLHTNAEAASPQKEEPPTISLSTCVPI